MDSYTVRVLGQIFSGHAFHLNYFPQTPEFTYDYMVKAFARLLNYAVNDDRAIAALTSEAPRMFFRSAPTGYRGGVVPIVRLRIVLQLFDVGGAA